MLSSFQKQNRNPYFKFTYLLFHDQLILVSSIVLYLSFGNWVLGGLLILFGFHVTNIEQYL